MLKQRTRGSLEPGMILALAVGAVLVIAAGASAFYFLAVKAPVEVMHQAKEETFDAANRMAQGFKSVFNFTPRVTVGGVTVVEQANSVVELATVQQDVVVDYHWSQTWLGSTKIMELRGIYRAKAGFSLRDPFQVSVDAGRITAELPAPVLLSLEMTSYKVLQDDNGWWNKITPEDRENAIAAMHTEARTKAVQAGLLTEAKAKFRGELAEVIKSQAITMPVEIHFRDERPQVSPEARR